MEGHALKNPVDEPIEWASRIPLPPLRAATASSDEFDTSQVWLTSDRLLRYWTHELGATMYDIRDAIAVTGTRCAIEVRSYLSRMR